MVETADRSAVGEEPRGDPTREWELFVRDDADDPLRHVGSVSAPDAATAREQASRLFAWYADDLWVCPADEVRRFSTHDLSEDDESTNETHPTGHSDPAGNGDREDRNPESATDQPVVDEDDTATCEAEEEPRVTEL